MRRAAGSDGVVYKGPRMGPTGPFDGVWIPRPQTSDEQVGMSKRRGGSHHNGI